MSPHNLSYQRFKKTCGYHMHVIIYLMNFLRGSFMHMYSLLISLYFTPFHFFSILIENYSELVAIYLSLCVFILSFLLPLEQSQFLNVLYLLVSSYLSWLEIMNTNLPPFSWEGTKPLSWHFNHSVNILTVCFNLCYV